MNILGIIFVSFISFIMSTYGLCQIVGVLFIFIPNKDYSSIFSVILWGLLLYGLYFIINKWFIAYKTLLLIVYGISLVLSFLSIPAMEKEYIDMKKARLMKQFDMLGLGTKK